MANKSSTTKLKEFNDFIRTADDDKPYDIFKTGLIHLNHIISADKGIRTRSIMQLVGGEKSGKTTLALDILIQAQRNKQLKEIEIEIDKVKKTINAAYIDFERSFDKKYAITLGVDVDKLLIVETITAEQSFDIVETLLSEGLQLIIIDSIAMFVPESEVDKSFQDNEKIASNAKVLDRVCKRLLHLADFANALIIVINQFRANISTMSKKEKRIFGGFTLQYVSKLTITLTRIQNSDNNATVRAFIEKNKMGREALSTEYNLVYGAGIDYKNHILTLAHDNDIIEISGAWYYYPSKESAKYKAQGGTAAAKTFPLEEISEQIEKKLSLVNIHKSKEV